MKYLGHPTEPAKCLFVSLRVNNSTETGTMSSLTGGSYPPALDDARERERLVQTIKDWSIANGLAVRPPPAIAGNDTEGILAMNAPVTIFPSPFPKSC